MKKMLLALCGAVLVMGQLEAQAQADIYKTPVVCTTEGASGDVKLNSQTGKLSGRIKGLSPSTDFDCRVTCGALTQALPNGVFIASCGTSNSNGVLNVNAPDILPDNSPCAEITIEVCVAGFGEGGCVEGFGESGDVFELDPCQGAPGL